MGIVFRTPFIVWLNRTIKNKILEIKNRKKRIKIGRLSVVINSSFGNYAQLRENVFVSNSKVGNYTKIDDNVSLNSVQLNDCSYLSTSSIISRTKIGKFCSIGPDCRIGLGKHPSKNFVSTHPVFFSTSQQIPISFADRNYFNEFEEIKIGNDVWVGSNCIIMDGVVIGDGAILAAGSVVTKDVPPYAIVGGVPAKTIRYRFEEEEIEFLLNFKWWDKDIDWLEINFKKFHNIKSFI